MKNRLILLYFLLALGWSGCVQTPMLQFEEVQPADGENLKQFPPELAGYFLIESFDQIPKSTAQDTSVLGMLKDDLKAIVNVELNEDRTRLERHKYLVLQQEAVASASGLSHALQGDTLVLVRQGQTDTAFLFRLYDHYFALNFDTLHQGPHQSVVREVFDLSKNEFHWDALGNEQERGIFRATRDEAPDRVFFVRKPNEDNKGGYAITRFDLLPGGDVIERSSILGTAVDKRGPVKTYLKEHNIPFQENYEKRGRNGSEEVSFIMNPNPDQFRALFKETWLFSRSDLRRLDLPAEKEASAAPWLFGGGAFVLLALIGWAFSRRKKAVSHDHELREEVHDLLAETRIHKATTLLLERSKDPITQRKVRLLDFQYKKAEENYKLGLMTYDEFKKEEAKTVHALLSLFPKA